MKTFILLIAITSIICIVPLEKIDNGEKLTFDETLDLYTNFIQNNQKGMLNFLEFDQSKFSTFEKNVAEIIAHNSNPQNSYKKGINKFSDLTDDEFNRYYLGASQNCSATLHSNIPFKRRLEVPDSWDWRTKSIVSPVKNQGKCGSCWTFSTTGAIEAHYALVNNVAPPILSEQQLVDCAQAFDNHGCRGGLPSHAFEYIMYNQGLEYEANYVYEAKDDTCRYNSANPLVRVSGGAYNITMGEELHCSFEKLRGNND